MASRTILSKMRGNRNGEINTRFVPSQTIRKADKKIPQVSQSQKELIAYLRGKLDDAGIRNDFIIEPDNSLVASHVIRALIRLAKKHDVDTGRRNRSLNGT